MKKKLQANIEGFNGKPTSLFGVIDTDTGVLNIVMAAKVRQSKKDGCVLISNALKAECDFTFNESVFKDAISSYYRLKRGVANDNLTPLLIISPKVGSSDPSSAIELNGVSDSGMDYRISAEISNLQLAVLAMCLYVEKSRTVDECFVMFDELQSLLDGNYLTI